MTRAQADIFTGLSGLGDLVVTCFSRQDPSTVVAGTFCHVGEVRTSYSVFLSRS